MNGRVSDIEPVLRQGMQPSEYEEVRRLSAEIVARIGHPVAGVVPELTALVSDSSVSVREWACDALGKIGPQAQPALPAIIVATSDSAPNVREWALYALGEIRTDPNVTIPVLTAAMNNANEVVAAVRDAAIVGLGKYGSHAREVAADIAQQLGEFEGTSWDAAVGALAKIDPQLLVTTASAALEQSVDDPSLWLHARATGYAALQQWSAAAADFQRIADQYPQQYAVCLLAAGDALAYQAECRSMFEKFSNGPSKDQWMAAIDTCVLRSDCGVSPDDVLQLAERLLATNPRKAANRASLGMALYRAGRYGEAVVELRQALALRDHPSDREIYDTWDYAFLAAALQELKRADEAATAYDQAVAAFEASCGIATPNPREGVRPLDIDWLLQTELQLLMNDLHGK
jgi:tetratricopeptide (TPR) repeat protein